MRLLSLFTRSAYALGAGGGVDGPISVAEELKADILFAEIERERAGGTPKAYDWSYEYLRGCLSRERVAEALSTRDHALLVVELDDIIKGIEDYRRISRVGSISYGYGRILEFARYTANKIEAYEMQAEAEENAQ